MMNNESFRQFIQAELLYPPVDLKHPNFNNSKLLRNSNKMLFDLNKKVVESKKKSSPYYMAF